MTIIGETKAIGGLAIWLQTYPPNVEWEMKKFPNGTRFLRITAPRGWEAIIVPARRRVWLAVNDPSDQSREFELGRYGEDPAVLWGRACAQMQAIYNSQFGS